MHRTVGIRRLFCRSAEVNGTKPKSLRTGQELPHRQQKSRARKLSLLGFQFVYIGVLSDDFAAIDFREELCYHSLTEKAQIRRTGKGTHSKRTVIPKKSRAKNNPNFGYSPRFGLFWCGDPTGTRTRVTAVKGRCLNRLTMGPYLYKPRSCGHFFEQTKEKFFTS